MRDLFAVMAWLMLPAPLLALEPKNVWLIVNQNVPQSREVANHYIAQRKIPQENIVALDLPPGEDISREQFNKKLVEPLRAALKEKKNQVKVLVTTYGVPLRVGRQAPTAAEEKELEVIRSQLAETRQKVAAWEKSPPANPQELATAKQRLNQLQNQERLLSHAESQASVDSELMLLWWGEYPLDRWVINPLYWQVSETDRQRQPPVLLVSRLDGPTAAIAKRLVDDAIATEKRGLQGQAVIDARGIRFDPRTDPRGTGYSGYDESMRETATLLEKAGLTVVLDDKAPLLPANAAQEVALYCGWYSVGQFVDCCAYVPGAIAWHLASFEATTLRNNDSKAWCPNLLKKGVCATLGPVAEPYTIGFPKPAEFFGFLVTGEYTLVECYARTTLLGSWMMVLVGDPLYRPFPPNGRLKSTDVGPSPKGAKKFLP
ncbi:MAG: TIGR03790 family protein [Gemmataceae bacterium]|nr:TIGR03790 family protein [Gemmata sp.]MDW8196836.1 TIGR03790 family protein [Gemmataceae bacterium]